MITGDFLELIQDMLFFQFSFVFCEKSKCDWKYMKLDAQFEWSMLAAYSFPWDRCVCEMLWRGGGGWTQEQYCPKILNIYYTIFIYGAIWQLSHMITNILWNPVLQLSDQKCMSTLICDIFYQQCNAFSFHLDSKLLSKIKCTLFNGEHS